MVIYNFINEKILFTVITIKKILFISHIIYFMVIQKFIISHIIYNLGINL